MNQLEVHFLNDVECVSGLTLESILETTMCLLADYGPGIERAIYIDQSGKRWLLASKRMEAFYLEAIPERRAS